MRASRRLPRNPSLDRVPALRTFHRRAFQSRRQRNGLTAPGKRQSGQTLSRPPISPETNPPSTA
jgi:hypothetical protein